MKSFIVAAVMASTVSAATETTKDAATPAVVKRAADMPCDGKLDNMGCADGLRCHTGIPATKQTPEDEKAAEKAAADLLAKNTATDKAAADAIAANDAATKAWEKKQTTIDWQTATDKFNAREAEIVEAKKKNEGYTNKDVTYEAASNTCNTDGSGPAVTAKGVCVHVAQTWATACAGAAATANIATKGKFSITVSSGAKDVIGTAKFNCFTDSDDSRFTYEAATPLVTYLDAADGTTAVTDSDQTPEVQKANIAAFAAVAANIANRYKIDGAADYTLEAPKLVVAKDGAVARTAFAWTPVPSSLPPVRALTGDAAKPIDKPVPLTAEQAEAKRVAEAAAAAKAATPTATPTETKKDTTATTPATATAKVAGPGACGTAEKCDTGEGAAKIQCSAEKLASGILSAIVVVSMM